MKKTLKIVFSVVAGAALFIDVYALVQEARRRIAEQNAEPAQDEQG